MNLTWISETSSRSRSATITTETITVPAGHHNGSGAVSIVLEQKSATPTKSAQTIVPTTGKVLSSVSVAAIPAAYQDVTSVDATAGDVVAGKTIVAADGTEVAGTMVDRGTVTASIDGLTVLSYTIPAGKHSGSGTVSLTNDIETALAAI